MSGSVNVIGTSAAEVEEKIVRWNLEAAITTEVAHLAGNKWDGEGDISIIVAGILSEEVLITITNYKETPSKHEEFVMMQLARRITFEELYFRKKFSECSGTFSWEATSENACLLGRRVQITIPRNAPGCTVSKVERAVTFYKSDCSGEGK